MKEIKDPDKTKLKIEALVLKNYGDWLRKYESLDTCGINSEANPCGDANEY